MTSATTTFEASESAARRVPLPTRDTDDDFCGGGSAHNEDEGCTRLVARGGIFGTQMMRPFFVKKKQKLSGKEEQKNAKTIV